MYSHRIIAFGLFTTLFFISSSLFAGLTWFLVSLRSATASPRPDERRESTISTGPPDQKEELSPRADLPEDDSLTISIPPTPRLDFSQLSSSTSRTYPPVVEPLAQEYYPRKREPSADSAGSEPLRPEDSLSTIITQVKNEDEFMSGDTEDDDVETIERAPTSEISF
jgi:hypothetical protein